MRWLLAVALALPAQVDVVDELRLEEAARDSAVGLLVPDAGPRTSEARARASLACGAVVNSLRDEPPACGLRLAESPDARVVLELPRGGEQANDRRYPVALRGEQGLLTSDSTRIPGLVSVADVATGRLEVVPHDDPATYLGALDGRIRENGEARMPAFLLALGLLAALALAWPRAAVLGFAGLLAANLGLGAAGVSEPWAVLLATGLSVAAGGPLLALAARSRTAVGGVLAAVLVAYLVVLGTQGEWVSLSPLGPTQNARFFGLSNHLATLLLVPALGAAALLRHAAAFAAVAAVALVAVAGSSFGADGGGAVVLLAGYAVLALLLHGAFPGGALVLVAFAVAAAAIVVGPETHVTGAGGGDVVDRVALSAERLADDLWTAAVTALSVAALLVLVLRGRRRPLPLAFAAAVATSLVVNDSPLQVALGGLVGYLALERYDSPR